MTSKVIKEAQYIIKQTDSSGILVNEEVHPGDSLESTIIDRSRELESINPEYITTWQFEGKIVEEIVLPGTVVEIPLPTGSRFFDVEGSGFLVSSATLNGIPLIQHFFAESVQIGDVVQFFDEDNNLVAEMVWKG